MKIKILIFSIWFIFTNLNFGQNNIVIPVTVFLQNLHIDASNSIGFSNTTYAIPAEIGTGNPATLSNFSSMAGGISFQYNTAIDYFSILDLKRTRQWLPSSFGIIYPIQQLKLGLSYHQKYSSFMDFEKIEITTPQQPEGTGEFYKQTSETLIHSPSLILAYSFSGLFHKNDAFSIGGQLFWDIWKGEEKIQNSTTTIDGDDYSWKIGLKYEINKKIDLGLLYEKGITMQGNLKYNNNLNLEPIDTTGYFQPVQMKITPKLELPDKLAAGISVKATENLVLSSTISNVFWKEVNSFFKNQIEISANVIYSYSNTMDFVLGIFSTDREINDRDHFDYSIPQNATYLNIGAKTKLENFILYFEILDSHLNSTDTREHIIIKAGLNYSFDKNNNEKLF